ncbi:MAG: hypothetical protein R3B40_10165 [Polyangiales bacterium]|nr:hypothetical protein [Sandaracinaceae bacterium]
MTQTGVAAVGAAVGLRLLSGQDAAPHGSATAAAGAARTSGATAGAVAPAPWALVAPLQAGSSIGNGWRIKSLSEVRLGASTLRVEHATGAECDVHICLRRGAAIGVAASRHFDFVLMNAADGGVQTNEALGVSLLALARRAEAQEAQVSRAGFMRHDARIAQYGWDQIT